MLLICIPSANSILFGNGLLTTLGATSSSPLQCNCYRRGITPGDHHKKQRKLMNPVFSIAHMRNMSAFAAEYVHAFRASHSFIVPLFQDVVSAVGVPPTGDNVTTHHPCSSERHSRSRRRREQRRSTCSTGPAAPPWNSSDARVLATHSIH